MLLRGSERRRGIGPLKRRNSVPLRTWRQDWARFVFGAVAVVVVVGWHQGLLWKFKRRVVVPHEGTLPGLELVLKSENFDESYDGFEAKTGKFEGKEEGYNLGDSEEEKLSPLTLVHLGDIMFSKNINRHVFRSDNPARIWRDVTWIWKEHADLTLSNFEGSSVPVSPKPPYKRINVTDENFFNVYTSSLSRGGFNYPAFIMHELARTSGIHVLSIANNHIIDRGHGGSWQTKRQLEELGFTTIGVVDPETIDFFDEDNPLPMTQPSVWVTTIEKNGWKLGLAACQNFFPKPKDNSTLMDCRRMEGTLQYMKTKMRDLDAIIAIPHWGQEFQTKITRSQREYTKCWLRAGATLILGNHIHMQQSAFVERSKRDNRIRQLVVYSLGSLVSGLGQADPTNFRLRASAVMFITLDKDENDETFVEAIKYTPVCEPFQPELKQNVFVTPTHFSKRCRKEEEETHNLFRPIGVPFQPEPEDASERQRLKNQLTQEEQEDLF